MIFSKSNPPPGYYVYLYLREDGTPYYVGKGIGRRAWDKRRNVAIPADDSRILFHTWNLREIGALWIECRLIRWYGRKDVDYSKDTDPRPPGILRNMTDGGDGASGYKHTEDTIKHLKIKGAGKNNGFYGKSHSEERNKEWAKQMKPYIGGKNHSTFDHTVYCWKNKLTGQVVHATQYDMYSNFDVSKAGINHVLSGHRPSHKGWQLKT